MEIKAQSVYDYETVKAMVRFSFYKRRSPRKTYIAYTAVMAVCVVILVALNLFVEYNSNFPFYLFVAAAGLLLINFSHFLMPKIRYNALKEMKDTVNNFVFTDECIFATSNNLNYSGNAQLNYGLFYKVYETDRYFFMFQDKLQLYIVDKNTIQGDANVISSKFQQCLKKKYIRCKY